MTQQPVTPLKAIQLIASVLVAVVTSTPMGEAPQWRRRFSGKAALDNQKG